MKKGRILVLAIIFVSILAVAILINQASYSKQETNDKIGIIVTIPPQAEFVEKIGGNKVKVTTMIPAGSNPHTYEPLPEQLKQINNARMYVELGSGLEFENIWMDKFKQSNKEMIILNSSNGIILMNNQDTDHADENQFDTHVWVSPRNAQIMVENIYQKLSEIDPQNKEYYKINKDKYIQELDNENKNITQALNGEKNKKIMVYHPAWGYFCKDYNLTQVSIEKNGKEPTPQGMISLIDQARKENIKIIFISPQFSKKSAETIASDIGGEVVTIDDMDKDYTNNLKNVAEAFKKALSSTK